jgi:hypothetical protein
MSDPAAMQGRGLMGEDLIARQAAQMQIEDVHGEQFDIMKSAKNEDFWSLGLLPTISSLKRGFIGDG